jgi:hypothetical protein
MFCHKLALIALLGSLFLLIAQPAEAMPAVARHPFKVGGIVAISATSITIRSKSHNANYTFMITGATRWLQHGVDIPRSEFHINSYVTISYIVQGSKWIAYHITLRRRH